jgi:hypothetical protein
MSEGTSTLSLAPAKIGIIPEQQRLLMAGIAGLLRIVGLFVFSITVVAWRRPDQLAAPILWFEEGTHILRNYADCGLCAMLPSINGNIALTAKVLLLPVLKISAPSAPALAAAIGIAFNAAVVCMIATAPTHLRARYLCALAALFVPTGTENYGIALYSVWWCGILIALALLWDTGRGLHWLRIALLVVGGLSTPFMIFAAPLFFLRAYREQNANEFAVALTACLLTVIAAAAAIASTSAEPFDVNLTVTAALLTVSKFFGLFVAPAANSALVPGCLLIVAIACLAYHERRKLDLYFLLLAALLAASIAATLLRAPMSEIDPFESGGRYFFLPYIFISFMLLWLWSSINPMTPLLKAAPLMIIAVAIVGGVQRSFFVHPLQERQSWSEAMLRCANTQGETVLPLGYTWTISMPQDKCRALIDGSLIR